MPDTDCERFLGSLKQYVSVLSLFLQARQA